MQKEGEWGRERGKAMGWGGVGGSGQGMVKGM